MGLAPPDFSDPHSVRRHKVMLVKQLRNAGVKEDANGTGLGSLPVPELEKLAQQHLNPDRNDTEVQLHEPEPVADDGMEQLVDGLFAEPAEEEIKIPDFELAQKYLVQYQHNMKIKFLSKILLKQFKCF